MSNSPVKILVACERSQVVTSAFRKKGVLAYSCDIEKCYGMHKEWHIQKDVREIIQDDWDIVIAHPPCTMLSKVSAVALAKGLHTIEDIEMAKEFFLLFTKLSCPTCIENPIPLKRAGLPKPSQYICPSQFGHNCTKKTCLWLYGLPQLLPMTGYYINPKSWIEIVGGNKRKRSRFFEGIALAMAEQWTQYAIEYRKNKKNKMSVAR